MTAIPQSAFNSDLSDRLTTPLRQVAQRRWKVDATVAICKTLFFALTILLLAALILGYLPNLWMPVRVALAIVAWALLIRTAFRFLKPIFRRWSLTRAAMHVEQDRPDLHERLSSAIELANDREEKYQASPSLIAHLFHQAEADANAVQPNQLVPTDRIVRWALLLAPVLLAWITLTIVPATTHTTLAGLYRVLMPWKSALPDMLTQIVVKPGDITLVQGDSLDVTTHLSFGADADHATLLRKYESGQTLTDALEQSDPRDYRLHLDNLQQTFAYRVSTNQGDSPWFTATVHPRPQITSVEIRCDYPAYTGLAATNSADRDGVIQALVGTRVTMTIHTALPVALSKSRIVFDTGSATENTLPLTQPDAAKAEYQAQFTITHSGDYRINLTNDFDLTNKDEQAHSIVAIPDEAPTIVILSPEPKATAGALDTVPVKYLARDDFGVAKVEALIQVGDGPTQTVPVNFTATDKRTIARQPFMISIADLLKGQTARTETITYQLKVTDNREPDPQFGFSAKQTLKIDFNDERKLEAREDRKTARELTEAIAKAVNQLNQEQQQIQPAREADPKHSLDDWRRKQLDQATSQLPVTNKELAKAADDAKDTAFADIAEQVKTIADKPIQAAADNAAQADLNVDKGQDRQEAANRAVEQIADARKQLEKILESQAIDKQLHKAEAARDLADAAQKQQEAAALMKTPEQVQQARLQPHQNQEAQRQQERAMEKQRQANQKLQEAMQQDQALRDPQAQETAQKLEQLIHKVDEAEKHQDTAATEADKQKAATDIQQAANAIAQQQEALNKEIQKAAEQNKQALQNANAQTPNPDQQQNIVKDLDRNQLQQAHQEMKQAADQLNQAAQQLQNQARANDLHPTPKQQEAINHDQHAADEAQKDRDAAKQAADKLKQPADPDAATADAKQAAEQIKKEAGDLHPQDEQAKQNAEAAEKHADAAEHAADQAAHATDAQEAQKDRAQAAAELNQAGKALAQAAKENADAHKAAMVAAQQKNAQAAADQAAQQAQKQAALAQAVADQQKALAKVPNAPQADQAAQQQNQIAEQTKEAKKDAEQLEQQAQHANNPNVEARAKHAEAELAAAQEHADHAAQAQQEAAHDQHEAQNADNAQHATAAEQHADHALAQAAEQEHQAQQALAKAEGDLRDAAQQPGNAQGQPTPAQQAAQAAQEAQQAQQDANQQNPAAAQEAANALAHAAQAMAKGMPGHEPGHEPGQPDNAQNPDARPSDHPAQAAGKTTDSKEGISFAGLPITLPASVLDLGITADQWAVLPPLVKKDLLNAAQQNGPPAYRQMMREYFAKVAKMQTTAGQP